MIEQECRNLAEELFGRRPLFGERAAPQKRTDLPGSFGTRDRVRPVLYPREKLRYPIDKRVSDPPEFIGTHVKRRMAPGIVVHYLTFFGVG
jgi:hypothetical protein